MKLVLIPTRKCPFEEIAMDFVRELPELDAINAIQLVTDWFTKVQHYILAKTIWSSEDVANCCIHDIW